MFSGLVTAWRLATWPTRRSPVLVKATTDGVGAGAFGVRDDDRLAAFHDRDDGVRRAQVDTNNFAHGASFRRSESIDPPLSRGVVVQ